LRLFQYKTGLFYAWFILLVKEVRKMDWQLIVKLTKVGLIIVGITLLAGFGFAGIGITQESNVVGFDGAWVYRNMELIVKEGLIKDYPVDWVKAGHKLSRLELAYYLKQVVLNLENKKSALQLPARIVQSIQALVIEFQKELSDLGIKTTDINKVSPNPTGLNNKPDSYQDLDSILSVNDGNSQKSYYYYGQYYSELQRKSFLFIPVDFVKTAYLNVLENNSGSINILYQPQLSSLFLVLKGNLPAENRSLKGYYLFPIEDVFGGGGIQSTPSIGMNKSILSLLDEVSQIQQVDNLFRYNGSINLEGFLKLKVDLTDKDKLFIGDLNQSLTIGGLLVYSNNSLSKTSETKDFGLPVFNSRQNSLITPVDLDQINSKTLQTLQINIQGTVEIDPQTLLLGGIDLLYQGSTISLDKLWPSDTKASAGVSFRYNDYWTFLTYQSLVNSQNNAGWFSTTSIGVEYNKWATLWLAYQFLKFDNPLLTGTLSFRF
jgi:hypothetical protein